MFDDDKAYSVSLWCRPTASGHPKALIVTQNGGADWNFEYGIYYSTDNKFEVRINKCIQTTLYEMTDTTARSANTWYHLVMIFDPTKISFYVNGVEVATTNYIHGAQPAAIGDFWLGSTGGATPTTFTGAIEDVRIYGRALSLQEVRALYYE